MPTYQYIREDGSTFEAMQSIKAKALETCPETGQKVKRVITGGSGVVYKGEGWYITDYKNKRTKPAPGAEASKTEAKAESTTTDAPVAEKTNGKVEEKV